MCRFSRTGPPQGKERIVGCYGFKLNVGVEIEHPAPGYEGVERVRVEVVLGGRIICQVRDVNEASAV